MDKMILPLLTLILGALLGGVVKVIQDRYAAFQEGHAVAAAIRAEISALVAGIRSGGYIEMLDRIIAYLSNPLHIVKSDDVFEASIARNPTQVFDAHCAKIGLLRSAIEPVVETYGHAKSLTEEIRFLPERHKRLPLTREQLVTVHQGMRTAFTEIISCGERAVTQLKQEEASGFLSCWACPPAARGAGEGGVEVTDSPKLTPETGALGLEGSTARLIVTRVAETWQFFAFVFAALVTLALTFA